MRICIRIGNRICIRIGNRICIRIGNRICIRIGNRICICIRACISIVLPLLLTPSVTQSTTNCLTQPNIIKKLFCFIKNQQNNYKKI